MLRVATREVSHPYAMVVCVEGYNPPLDCFAHSASLHRF